jgi:anti-sigma regulatory factor (Ser/Thr protein kinase)
MCQGTILWESHASTAVEVLKERAVFLSVIRTHSGWDLDEDSARLIFTEIVGNAIRHAQDPTRARLVCNGSVVELCVTDSGSGFRTIPSPPSPTSQGGRGLFLVSAYADAVHFNRGNDRFSITARLPRNHRPQPSQGSFASP